MIISPENRAVFTDQLRQRRRGGRPRSTPTVPTSVRLPAPVFDAACAYASRRHMTVHAALRDIVTTHAGCPVQECDHEFS